MGVCNAVAQSEPSVLHDLDVSAIDVTGGDTVQLGIHRPTYNDRCAGLVLRIVNLDVVLGGAVRHPKVRVVLPLASSAATTINMHHAYELTR